MLIMKYSKGVTILLIRNCAGGVVFHKDKVLLLKNEKEEWVFPKGVIRTDQLAHEVAVSRVQFEAGVKADIIEPAGQTSYEFYSISRRRPVCNRITWYLMTSDDDETVANLEEGFSEGGFFPYEDALERITYSQDKSLLAFSHKRLVEQKKEAE